MIHKGHRGVIFSVLFILFIALLFAGQSMSMNFDTGKMLTAIFFVLLGISVSILMLPKSLK